MLGIEFSVLMIKKNFAKSKGKAPDEQSNSMVHITNTSSQKCNQHVFS